MTFLRYRMERYLSHLSREIRPVRSFSRLKRTLLLSAVGFVLLMGILAVTFSGIGMISQVEARSINWSEFDTSGLPSEVVDDARNLAGNLYGSSRMADLYYKQLLLAYSESIDHDFIIFFNPGGWGTRKLQDSPEWNSIISGIRSEIESAGYRVIVLNYHRTYEDFRSKLIELKEMFTGYPNKAKDLSGFVNFLTSHQPGLNVILAGESTGTVICDNAMIWLQDNDRVYSIQTGSPFWHRNYLSQRTLLVNDNGIVPDSFSKGDIITIIKSSFRNALGLNEADEGTVLNVFSAPGHQYWWQNPGVYTAIESFLEKYFGLSSDLQSTD